MVLHHVTLYDYITLHDIISIRHKTIPFGSVSQGQYHISNRKPGRVDAFFPSSPLPLLISNASRDT